MNTLPSQIILSSDQVKGLVLLEEWPHTTKSPMSSKKVSFSTYSHCKRYRLNAELERNKSYSSSDRKSFKLEAYRDPVNIKAMIEASPFEGGKALGYLIRNKMLQPEQLLGIEGLIAEPEKAAMERKTHATLVLKAQEHWQRMTLILISSYHTMRQHEARSH